MKYFYVEKPVVGKKVIVQFYHDATRRYNGILYNNNTWKIQDVGYVDISDYDLWRYAK